MKRGEQRIDEILDRGFTRFGEPSVQQVTADLARLRERLDPAVARTSSRSSMEPKRSHRVRRWLIPAAAAAVIFVALVVTTPWSTDSLATIAEGSLHTGSEGTLRQGDAMGAGEVVRSNGGLDSVIELSDGSRIEMRSKSELSLEHADDGVRIRLRQGEIIVNAAKQRAGHLYVQTKEVTVSVVGTVFIVNASEGGSRVAVIEGEVHVQEGGSEKTLRPGEQVATSPMAAPAMNDVIAWSRNAQEYRTLLSQQTAVVSPAGSAQKPTGPREAFELASIRPRPVAARGGGRGDVLPSGFPPACGGILTIDPRRFLATNVSVYQLIALAYDKKCEAWEQQSESDGLSGGPEWIRSEKFDIEALRPVGPADFTTRPLSGGMSAYEPGPRLRTMLQTLLAERFSLAMRREMRDLPLYELRVARGAPKLVASKEEDTNLSYFGVGLYDAILNGPATKPYIGQIVGGVIGGRAPMSQLAFQLEMITGRPVLDRTGVPGEFNYEVFFAPAQYRAEFRRPGDTRPQLASPSLLTVLEEELGLRLEATRGPVEVLVIERVERPTDN